MSRWGILFAVFYLSAMVLLLLFADGRPSCQGQDRTLDKGKDDGPPKVGDMKAEVPKEGMVYVWPLPSQGHQSLVVLNVIDGNTIDAAYLVPVRIKIKGAVMPGLDDKGGKDAQKAVDKLIGGQLRTAQLWGVGKEGVLADFWITPEKEGEKGQWLSAILIKQGVAKESK